MFLELIAELQKDEKLSGFQPLIELGRYLTAESGLYLTKVIDKKDSRGKTFAITDGGMNHHITATGNFGQVFRKAYPITNLSGSAKDSQETVSVAGPC